jgi:hypothetical protein
MRVEGSLGRLGLAPFFIEIVCPENCSQLLSVCHVAAPLVVFCLHTSRGGDDPVSVRWFLIFYLTYVLFHTLILLHLEC